MRTNLDVSLREKRAASPKLSFRAERPDVFFFVPVCGTSGRGVEESLIGRCLGKLHDA
jgi:hypothetical protein